MLIDEAKLEDLMCRALRKVLDELEHDKQALTEALQGNY